MAIMSTDINEEMPNIFRVELLNGEVLTLACTRVVVTTNALPIWLDTQDGTRYNFQNIVSLRRA